MSNAHGPDIDPVRCYRYVLPFPSDRTIRLLRPVDVSKLDIIEHESLLERGVQADSQQIRFPLLLVDLHILQQVRKALRRLPVSECDPRICVPRRPLSYLRHLTHVGNGALYLCRARSISGLPLRHAAAAGVRRAADEQLEVKHPLQVAPVALIEEQIVALYNDDRELLGDGDCILNRFMESAIVLGAEDVIELPQCSQVSLQISSSEGGGKAFH
mmetsp:Transcript_52629/g.163304  ORF Transcript_52629/g.163304 Transcript_52629/m.163304 type:complete len:215 (+) Transcript_52629:848-1492(+)